MDIFDMVVLVKGFDVIREGLAEKKKEFSGEEQKELYNRLLNSIRDCCDITKRLCSLMLDDRS